MKNKISIFLIIVIFCFGFLSVKEAKAAIDTDVLGWAWSENIGWISFASNNCDSNLDGVTDQDAYPQCPAGDPVTRYIVGIDSGNGLFGGWAWSENIGWISFNQSDLAGCPIAPCEARIAVTGQVSGWARAYRAIEPEGQTLGGWDGWIRLRDTNYGVWLDPSFSPMEFRDWAWGGDDNNKEAVTGWISFNDRDFDGSPGPVDYQVVSEFNIAPANNPPTAINLTVNPVDCCFRETAKGLFEWTFDDDDPGADQYFYEIEVIEDSGYNSGKVSTVGLSGYPDFAYIPINRFLFNKTFNWRLKVEDDQGADSGWINGPPFQTGQEWPWPEFIWDPVEPIVEEDVIFTNQTDECLTPCICTYTFEDGLVPELTGDCYGDMATVTNSFTSKGNKQVALEVKDKFNHSCTIFKTINIEVEGLPLPKWKEIAPF